MIEELVVPVARATAMVVVFASRVPEDLEARMLARLSAIAAQPGDLEDIAGMALRLHEMGALDIDVVGSDVLPPPTAEAFELFGAEPRLARHLAGHKRVVTVFCPAPFSAPPLHVWIASLVGGIASDLLGEPVFEPLTRQLRGSADIEAAIEGGEAFRLGTWMVVLVSQGPDGARATTLGLERLGLPELQMTLIPPVLAGSSAAFMTGLGRVLVRELFIAAEEAGGETVEALTLSRTVTVTDADIAWGYGTEIEPGASTQVTLRLDPPDDLEGTTFLTVVAPDDWPRSHGELLAQAFAELMGPDEDVELAEPDDRAAMERAMAHARGLLPRARELFAELPPGRQMILKHRLESAAGSEYVWGSVTDWADPERVRLVCLDDAGTDDRVRTGRPFVADGAALVDWAIIGGGEPMLGGWTQGVLTGEPVLEPPGRRRFGRRS